MIIHDSVLPTESLEALEVKAGQWYVDGTFGAGGHSRLILEQGGKVLGFDWDLEAIESAQKLFATEIESGDLILEHSSFSQAPFIVKKHIETNTITHPNAYFFDFGTNASQLTSSERGFSFSDDGPLDMRMDVRKGVTAADILTVIPQKQLEELFTTLGGENESKQIAAAIKKSPEPITTVAQLSELISKTKRMHTKLHPATKVFQALRIAVNSELEEIEELLDGLEATLTGPTRIITISFHEGEDRIVKHTFRDWESEQLGTNVTKKPIVPSAQEIQQNPRARSAKLRVFEWGSTQ